MCTQPTCEQVGVTLLIMLWLVAAAAMSTFFIRDMKRTLREQIMGDKEGADSPASTACAQALEAFLLTFSRLSILGSALRLCLLIFPWPLLTGILVTCWDCFDFEAAAAHQIGHLLGLGHPDLAPHEAVTGFPASGQNSYHAGLAAGIPLNYSSCKRPWADVYPGVPPGSGSGIRPSIMQVTA